MQSRWPTSTLGSVLFLLLPTLFIVTILAYANAKGKDKLDAVKVAHASAQVKSYPVTVTTPVPVVSPADSQEQEAIDSYIKTIFGPDADMAIQVQRHECSPQNKMYTHCKLVSKVEWSVGIFQINLQSDTAKVYFARIPGNTLEEKEE